MKKFDDLLDTLNPLDDIINRTRELSIFEISSEFLKDSNFYVPMATGDLKRSGITHSDFANGRLVWMTPYARRLFYSPEYNFSKDANPNARGLWAEYAKNQNVKKYQRIIGTQFDKAKREVL